MKNLERTILVIGFMKCSLCFSRVPLNGAVTSRHLVWSLVTLCLISLVGYRAYKREPVNVPSWPIFAVMLCFLAMAVFTLFNAVSRSDAVYEICTIVNTIGFLFVAAVVLKNDRDFFIKSTMVIALVMAAYGIYQYFTVADPVGRKGTMGFRNLWACAHALLVPMCIYGIFKYSRLWKVLGLVSVSSLIVSIFLPPLTRSVFLALVIAGISTIIFKPKLSLILVLCIVSAGLFYRVFGKTDYIDFALNSDSMQERLVVWASTIEMIKANPGGVGAGNWVIVSPAYLNGDTAFGWAYSIKHFLSPHNDFLRAYAETGLIGGSCYLMIFILALYSAWKSKCIMSFAGIVIFIVYAAFSFPGRRVFHPMILLIYIAFALDVRPVCFSRVQVLIIGFIVISGMSFVTFDYYKRHETNALVSRVIARKGIQDHYGILHELNSRSWFAQFGPLQEPLETYRGEAYLALNEFDKAIEGYSKAVEVHPYHFTSLNNLGGCYALVGRYKEAEEVFRRALEYWPNHEEIKGNLELVLNDKQKIARLADYLVTK